MNRNSEDKKKKSSTLDNAGEADRRQSGKSVKGEGDTTAKPNQKSPVKFFFLWFGIPLLAIFIAGWIAGHC